MNCALASLGVCALCALGSSGCTLAQQYNDVQSTNQRIAEKEVQLNDEQQRQVALQSQMRQLSADLQGKTMTSDQLDARLAALQRANRQTAEDTAAERAKKQRIDAQLAQSRAALAAAKAAPAKTAVDQRDIIEKTREQIRIKLNLLAQGG